MSSQYNICGSNFTTGTSTGTQISNTQPTFSGDEALLQTIGGQLQNNLPNVVPSGATAGNLTILRADGSTFGIFYVVQPEANPSSPVNYEIASSGLNSTGTFGENEETVTSYAGDSAALTAIGAELAASSAPLLPGASVGTLTLTQSGRLIFSMTLTAPQS